MKKLNLSIEPGDQPLRVIFWGYHHSGLTTYRYLKDAGIFDIIAVILPDNREHPSKNAIKTDARTSGIPVLFPTNLTDPHFIRALRDLQPDMFMVDSYSRRIPPSVIDIVGHMGFNLHPGILPRYRGAHVLNWALINGEKETGLTLHVLSGEFDTGPVVACEKVRIDRSDDVTTVDRKLIRKIPALMKHLEKQIKSKCIKAVEQSGPATHYRARTPEDGRIERQENAEQVYNKVRALTHPWPGAFLEHHERKLTIWKCLPEPLDPETRKKGLAYDGNRLFYTAADHRPLKLLTINDPQASTYRPVSGKEIPMVLQKNGIEVPTRGV